MRKFRKRQPSAVGTLHQQLASVLGPKMPSWLGGLDLSGAYESIREPTPAEQLLGLLRENPELLGPALVEILAPYLPPVIVAVVRVMDNNEGGRGDGN